MAEKSKAKGHKGGLEVTATVTGADGAQYTICGCSVEEVKAAVVEVRNGSAPIPSPADQGA